MRKKVIFETMLVLALAGCVAPRRAQAQFLGYTSPQTVQQTALTTAVVPTTFTVQNIGQTFHVLTYAVNGAPTAIQLRLEGSSNGTTWQAISDDATDSISGGGVGQVVAIGYYPVVRVNLVQCVGCGGGNNVTATYSGTSGASGAPWGSYNPAQQIRKVALIQVAANAANSAVIVAPYGSMAGYLVVKCTISCGTSASVNVTGSIAEAIGPTYNFSLLAGSTVAQIFPVPATAATFTTLAYNNGGGASGNVSIYYVFYPPGGALPATAQPAATQNSETTATHAAITKTFSTTGAVRIHLFAVNARCSAGTSSITVSDGATQIWSTAATEVSTTTFKFQWNPSLSSSTNNNMVIVLADCGVANVGTLDVQASVF